MFVNTITVITISITESATKRQNYSSKDGKFSNPGKAILADSNDSHPIKCDRTEVPVCKIFRSRKRAQYIWSLISESWPRSATNAKQFIQ